VTLIPPDLRGDGLTQPNFSPPVRRSRAAVEVSPARLKSRRPSRGKADY